MKIPPEATSVPRVRVEAAAPLNTLRRTCDCAGEEDCECAGEKKMKRSASGPVPAGGIPPAVGNVLRSGGHALDPDVRAGYESRFGVDFGNVRIHTGGEADASARAVRANAYTVGRDVVFAAGRYAPRTEEGARLLAHELTHVAQQRGAESAMPEEISNPGDESEREADRVADELAAKGRQP